MIVSLPNQAILWIYEYRFPEDLKSIGKIVIGVLMTGKQMDKWKINNSETASADQSKLVTAPAFNVKHYFAN